MNRQNSHFLLAHLQLLQRSLVVKLGVSPRLSRSLTRSHSLSSGDSTTGLLAAVLRRSLAHHNYQSTATTNHIFFSSRAYSLTLCISDIPKTLSSITSATFLFKRLRNAKEWPKIRLGRDGVSYTDARKEESLGMPFRLASFLRKYFQNGVTARYVTKVPLNIIQQLPQASRAGVIDVWPSYACCAAPLSLLQKL
jgi:hypothetical protein